MTAQQTVVEPLQPNEKCFVRKPGNTLLEGLYMRPAAAAGRSIVLLSAGSVAAYEEEFADDMITPVAGAIRMDRGALIITEQRGSLKVHGPFESKEDEFRFRDMWHGNLGLTFRARIDLAEKPIVMRDGQGLEELIE